MGNTLESEETGPEWTQILAISIPTFFALIMLTAAFGIVYYYRYRKAPIKPEPKNDSKTNPNLANPAGSFKAKRRLSVSS